MIPQANEPDLDEVDEAVKASVAFVPVSSVDEVLKIALEREPDNKEKQVDMPVVDNMGERWNSVTQ